ncbi:6,7-dimethyl-8-ribityllumazine synthase [Pseudoprevotella muciniphila]|uniref:6,7-dimethyl-8-ribityllumazine synthase n=1 Tax=Pseudoprevotella muciniphila TaxID=2133944 RepID=A0A5P8E579_9BACT|nr:6,7-dimethyl-8-ribityllumazine synthase [Pseudoprevotella muciniphila]QFQ12078.1 6,7-dimethyl-8-ribityllumazine synthase [Pseudoprevotella muciniphila]
MSAKDFKFTANQVNTIPDASEMQFGIVVSEWNNDITDNLLENAVNTLKRYGAKEENILVKHVPGSFELVYGAACMKDSTMADAIIAIGCVIRGDTPHFDYICSGVTQGLAELNTESDVPVIYGVLTVNDHQQALDRCGGSAGNKGEEFALTAIKMVDFVWSLENLE